MLLIFTWDYLWRGVEWGVGGLRDRGDGLDLCMDRAL